MDETGSDSATGPVDQSPTGDPTPILDALCAHYAHRWSSGGAARWLRHAWSTLAVVGHVPWEVPPRGIDGADARVRLAALALFGAAYDDLDEDIDPPEIFDGPFPLADADMKAWMAAHDLLTVAQLEADSEGLDPADLGPDSPAVTEYGIDPSLRTEDVEFAIDAVAQDVIGQYSRLRESTGELFAELWAQGHPAADPEDELDTRNGGPLVRPHSTYPLNRAEVSAILDDGSPDTHEAYERLQQQIAALRS